MIKLKKDNFSALAPGADIRVMTANIESEEWGGSECEPRAEILFANLEYYKPDVIGVQEVSVGWSSVLKNGLKQTEYSILYDVVPNTDSNYCPLLYNHETLDVVDAGAYRLSIGGPSRARTVTWGVFRVKKTGKAVGVLNTHLDWLKDSEDYDTKGCTSHYSREMQVRQLAETFMDLQEKYPEANILMTGDWNTLKSHQPLNLLCELTSVKYAEDVARDHDWGNEVDHIFVQEKTKILRLHLYRENGCDLGATDHPWGFADIAL